jgi:hypothetical protein
MMYLSERLARDRYREALDRAHEDRRAHQMTELRRVSRIQQRAERKLLDAWRRADEVRETLGVAP